MSDKVTPIRPGAALVVGEPQPGLAEMLRTLADEAERGELQSFVGAGFKHDSTRVAAWYLQEHHDMYAMLGSIVRLQREYMDRFEL